MKQTTIKLELEEEIFGANVLPAPARGSRYQYTPKPEEIQLWEAIVTGAPWSAGKRVEPKEGQPDNLDWWKELGARVVRICENRPKVKTRVRVVKTFPGGSPRIIAVTAFWNRPKIVPTLDPIGVWTLKEHRNAKDGKGRILNRIAVTLGCDGDELYCHLPDGDIPEGYDCFPDVGDILVARKDWTAEDQHHWWRFHFRPTRNRRRFARIIAAASIVHDMQRPA